MVITFNNDIAENQLSSTFFTGLNKEKLQITEMVPSLNLHDLVFPYLASLYCDVIPIFSDQQAVDIGINEKLEHVNVETLKNKSNRNHN